MPNHSWECGIIQFKNSPLRTPFTDEQIGVKIYGQELSGLNRIIGCSSGMVNGTGFLSFKDFIYTVKLIPTWKILYIDVLVLFILFKCSAMFHYSKQLFYPTCSAVDFIAFLTQCLFSYLCVLHLGRSIHDGYAQFFGQERLLQSKVYL